MPRTTQIPRLTNRILLISDSIQLRIHQILIIATIATHSLWVTSSTHQILNKLILQFRKTVHQNLFNLFFKRIPTELSTTLLVHITHSAFHEIVTIFIHNYLRQFILISGSTFQYHQLLLQSPLLLIQPIHL